MFFHSVEPRLVLQKEYICARGLGEWPRLCLGATESPRYELRFLYALNSPSNRTMLPHKSSAERLAVSLVARPSPAVEN